MLALAAYGTNDEERGATGVFTESDDVNLGDPIWEWD